MADIAQRPNQVPAEIDEKKRQKLLELVRGRALARPTDLSEDEVMVWPSLVVVEAVCAVVFLGILTVLSLLVNAPLTEQANPNQTPNPSKAPWYFLNLQEMLLHMDPGLAGVIIPSITLGALAAIPYIDRSPLGVGILGTSSKGRQIIGFSVVFTSVVLIGMVVLDEVTERGTQFGLGTVAQDLGAPEWVGGIVLSSLFIVVGIAILAGLVKSIFKPTTREMIIALYTGFFVAYWLLAFIGTSFRGPGQELMWPWDLPLVHH
jgi:menaquinol-cytochrome c reductase cytochrome b/c subunit